MAFIPQRLTFEEAAALPQAGLMALQSLVDKEQVGPGKKVLINGAGGGVGTLVLLLSRSPKRWVQKLLWWIRNPNWNFYIP